MFAILVLVAMAGAAGGQEPAVSPPAAVEKDKDPQAAPVGVRLTEDVVVQAIRAQPRTPVTKTDISQADLERVNHGQEMPFLLKGAPAVTQYSDTGTGMGYAYLYLRGIPQTRLNLTLDGVPLSESEDGTLYYVDFGDFASALDSVQIQRGVGTSSVGSASFGGSINFASAELRERPEATALLSAGSFGTERGSISGQTGRFGPGIALSGRAYYGQSDGFRHGASVEQRSLFFGASRKGDRSFFKLFGFTGDEKTGLSFLAVDEPTLEADLRTNPMSPDERDQFGQDFAQAQWTRVLGSTSTIAVQGYYNGAQGFYRIYADPERTTLYQYDLDWRMLGGLVTFNHEKGPLGITAGVHANDFRSDHARQIVDGADQYANNGFKTEASAFGKVSYDVGRWRLFGDLQLRHASFRFEGDLDFGSVSWTFFNPKLGARFAVGPSVSLYVSAGRAGREPARADLFAGEDNPTLPYDLEAVSSESVWDFEAGVEYQTRRLHLLANVYSMEFRNEIAQTGELSEIGLPLRRNVDRSYRRGVELEARYQATDQLRIAATANANQSRIATWNQSIDLYDADGNWTGAVIVPYHDVSPLLTPPFVGNLAVDYTPNAAVQIGLAGRYVAEAHLDNTGTSATATPDFFNLDASLSLSFGRWVKKGEPRLRVQAVNLLDNRREWPSGYSYLYYAGRSDGGRDLVATPYYYPLATRGVFASLDVRF